MKQLQKLNAFQIKLIIAVLMLLDHLRMIQGFIPPTLGSIIVIVSRCVAPMFAYLAVEGIRHTRNRNRYLLRLLIWASVMLAGNIILNSIFNHFAGMISRDSQVNTNISNHVVLTLALGVFCIIQIDRGKESGSRYRLIHYILAAMCFIVGFALEWGTIILPFMLVVYYFRNNRMYRYIGYGIIEIFALLISFSEPFYFLVFPLILLYNGQRGPNNAFAKKFFYIFYPAHIWCIAIINFIIIYARGT